MDRKELTRLLQETEAEMVRVKEQLARERNEDLAADLRLDVKRLEYRLINIKDHLNRLGMN